jgi:PST family polysaccharide transporter
LSVGGKAVQGVIWNLGTGLIAKMIAMLGSVIILRFIDPAEAGAISDASICVLTATMVSTVGTNQWIIARKANHEDTWHALVLHLSLGLAAYGVVMAMGTQLGVALKAPGMERFIPGFALAGFLEKVQYVPEKILARKLSFRSIALARGLGDIVYTATSLALAPRFSAWGMVWGNVVRGALVATLMIVLSDRKEWLRPAKLKLATVRAYFVYGWPIGVGAIAEFVSQRWDNLLVSRFYGEVTVGYYAQAYNLAEAPTGAIADQIGAVLMPSFARLEEEERVPALVRAGSLMALVMFPLAVGLGVVSTTLFAVIFPPIWQPAAPLLLVLSVLSIVKPLSWTLVGYTHAQQKRRLIMLMGIFKAVTVLTAIVLIGSAGIIYTCWAVGIAFALYALVYLWFAMAPNDKAFWQYLAGCLPVLLACGPMIAAVFGVRHLADQRGVGPSWVSLICEITAGGSAYVLASLLIARRVSKDFLNLLQNGLRRRNRPA